jgi:hypothetical protein
MFELVIGADFGSDNGIVSIGKYNSLEEAIKAELEEFWTMHEWYGSYIVQSDTNKIVAERNGVWNWASQWWSCPIERECTCG